MIVSETTRRALKEFGLTEYEVKAYIGLVESGPMPASQLSTTATIPYSKIYEILGNLERKGWVETDQADPGRNFPKLPVQAAEPPGEGRETRSNSAQMAASPKH